MPISETERQAVEDLIEFIESRPALSKAERDRLSRRQAERMAPGMLAGQSSGQASGFRGVAFDTNDQETAREQIKEVDNDLQAQIRIVRDGVEHYYEAGWYPAPYYPWRIAVMLRKAKEHDLERRLLEVWNARWSDGLGRRYQQLQDREEKARALAQNHG